MFRRHALQFGLLALLLGAVPMGCGTRTLAPEEVITPEMTPLQEIGIMYQMYLDENKRPPKSVGDFAKYGPGFSYGFDSLRRGEFEVIWGINLEKSPEAATTVLAYQKQAPEQGGYVLMKDGTTVKKMTAEEFKAATKAGKSGS